jgi:hypothetical protein
MRIHMECTSTKEIPPNSTAGCSRD